MATFTYTISTTTSPAAAEPITEVDKFFGRDLFWSDDVKVTPAGDWLLVEKEEALRQAVLRRLITSPGEWKTRPDYGVGAGDFVRARHTQATLDELAGRIRDQLLRDVRIYAVEDIATEFEDGLLRINVAIKPRGEPKRAKPIVVSLEVK